MSVKIPLQYSKKQVSKAGDILTKQINSTPEEQVWAYDVLQNFRAAHSYPINTFQATLRDRLASVDPDALVAQRLKRTPSIAFKLLRYPEMKLARMQDIGGIRAVVKDMPALQKLHAKYKFSTRFAHELIGEKNYINTPKPSGYRGIHLIYKYMNPLVPEYNGLQIELQLRTKLQHVWATTVETVGTYLDYSLKSSQGPEDWLSFFALISSAFALIEKTNPLEGLQGIPEDVIYKKVLDEAERLTIVDKLMAFSIVTEHIANATGAGSSYHLIVLDPHDKTVRIRSFARRKLDEATNAYSEYEKDIIDGSLQVVLVATDSIASLRQAYPNYFLDTHEFIKSLDLIRNLVRVSEKKLPISDLLSKMLRKST